MRHAPNAGTFQRREAAASPRLAAGISRAGLVAVLTHYGYGCVDAEPTENLVTTIERDLARGDMEADEVNEVSRAAAKPPAILRRT